MSKGKQLHSLKNAKRMLAFGRRNRIGAFGNHSPGEIAALRKKHREMYEKPKEGETDEG